ncbi:LytR/AlgR family response regulator transcription factor [Pseudomonadota bacterium]
MLNILIIDDEQPARDRLRRLLHELPRCEVVGEAASSNEALESIRELSPDVLLLDISMPGMVLRLLKRKWGRILACSACTLASACAISSDRQRARISR